MPLKINERLIIMYENEIATPRQRINDELFRRAVDERQAGERSGNNLNCRGEEITREPHSRTWGLEDHPLASVYAPMQIWRNLYDTTTALDRGTLFKELDLPFVCGERTGGGCCGK